MAPPSWSTTVEATPDHVLFARLTVPLGERFALAGLIAEAARTSDDEPSPRPRRRRGTPRRRSWSSG